MSVSGGRPLLATSSSESANGITSSWRECRITEFGFERRGRAPILPCWAKQDERRVSAVDVHGDCTATGRTDDHIRLVLIVFGLSGADGQIEVVIVQCRVDDFVASVFQVGRFDAADDAVPAVEEKDSHVGSCRLTGTS